MVVITLEAPEILRQEFARIILRGVKAAKNLLTLRLAFKQEYPDYDTARKVEGRIKKLKRRDYVEKIIKEERIKIEI